MARRKTQQNAQPSESASRRGVAPAGGPSAMAPAPLVRRPWQLGLIAAIESVWILFLVAMALVG